jgi:hypothetical protein
MESIFISVFDDMGRRMMDEFRCAMYSSPPNQIDEQTENNMIDDISNFLATTQKYSFRIPFIMSLSPLSLLIESTSAYTYACSPACMQSSHVPLIIILKSRFLNPSTADELLRLMVQIISKPSENDKKLGINKENKENIEKLQGQYCNINDSFMGKLKEVTYNEQINSYNMKFIVCEYNQERTELKETNTIKDMDFTEGVYIQKAVPLVFKCPNYFKNNRNTRLYNSRVHTPVRIKNLAKEQKINRDYEREDIYFGNIKSVEKRSGFALYDNYKVEMNEKQPNKEFKLLKAAQVSNKDPPLHELITVDERNKKHNIDSSCNTEPITALGTLQRSIGWKDKNEKYQ